MRINTVVQVGRGREGEERHAIRYPRSVLFPREERIQVTPRTFLAKEGTPFTARNEQHSLYLAGVNSTRPAFV